MSSSIILDEVTNRISDWENDMSQFFGLWNTWANSYRMIDDSKARRPVGVSKNITAETPRAVNALATTITRMQTSHDPPFELRSDDADEEVLYNMEKSYSRMLTHFEFKRNLLKGNRSLCLFGTQVWEEPYIPDLADNLKSFSGGTSFMPASLLQVAFEPSVYDIRLSDYIATLNRMNYRYLRFISNLGEGIWDKALIEEGIKEKGASGGHGNSDSSIESRRGIAGYQGTNRANHELILWHGRLSDESLDDPVIVEMWEKSGRTDDPKFKDITVGILDRKRIVRLHPTPYGTWHHLFKIGHYIEFELEPIACGVGRLGGALQKDMNRLVRYVNDVSKFSLWNIFLAGRGAGLKSANMNVFPWSAIQVDDVNQIRELKPQLEGIAAGLKINEITREDFRGVTHATSTLQAILTGATATESTLAQNEAIRAISLTAEVNGDSVIKPHIETMHRNNIDQNPYDNIYPRNVEVIPKITTDKDFRPEHVRKLIEIATFIYSIRSQLPLDFNGLPILKYLVKSVGINPREIKAPRPEIDRMLDILRRTNANSELKNEMLGEEAGLRNFNGGVSKPVGEVPNSPVSNLGVL